MWPFKTHPAKQLPDSLCLTAPVDILALAKGDTDQSPKFRIVANTGVPMRLEGFLDPVVIDLKGAKFDRETTPIIFNHDVNLRIGHTTKQEVRATGNPIGIFVEGVVSSGMGIAAGFVEDSKRGFPFQASTGASIVNAYFVPEGNEAKVNGQTFAGPLIVASETRIKEISVAVLGADPATTSIAASFANKNQGNNTMPDNIQAAITAERERIATINAMLPKPGKWQHLNERIEELRASAVAGQKTVADITREINNIRELEAHYAGMEGTPTGTASGPFIHRAGGTNDAKTLEAAVAMHAKIQGLEKHYDERTLEAANRTGVCHVMDVARICAQQSGREFNPRNKDSVLKAAFSSTNFSSLLSNVAGKSLMESYQAFPSVAKIIARKLSPKNFKEHTGIRITGDIRFLEVAGDGELKHARLDDSSYTYRLSTWGRMFGMDRQSLINDDLDGLAEVPRMLGRGAALALEQEFWTLVLSNPGSFFHTDNGNLISGAGSALSSAGLASAVQAMIEAVDAEGYPVNIVPKYLVVPPALLATADELYASHNLNPGGANTDETRGSANVLFQKYEPHVSPYLGANSGLAGVSDTAFYLFGGKEDVAAFGIAYLDGNEVPTIEEQDQPFNTLGMSWRGFFDFGCCTVDHRGAVKSTGA